MPTPAVALIIFGGVLLLIGLVGGPFKFLDFEVRGPVQAWSRWIAGLMGALVMATAVYMVVPHDGGDGPPPKTGDGPGTPSKPSLPPVPPPATGEEAANALFVKVSEWPPNDRLRKALDLALSQERDIEGARRLLAEAGCPQGFVMQLPMKTYLEQGGKVADLQRIERALDPIGVRIDQLGPEGRPTRDVPPGGPPPCHPRP